MGPKKEGKKERKKEAPPPVDGLTEVDKAFYELQITDLNRKLSRLRTLSQELQDKNDALTKEIAQLDEDRADVISYLKKSMLEKENEIKDLQERLQGLEETRQDDTEHFQETIKNLEIDFRNMHEQLTSEVKLLQGKLNSLEEFRIQRDELMRKYEDQEKLIEEQEVKHKREMYEVERKFIIGKDKIKQEMEARLLQLSTDFQDATEVRIASTTHRVIRENIAINNELDILLETQQRLQEENEKLKYRNKVYRLQSELHEVEKKKALHRAKVQYKLIERLSYEQGLQTIQIAQLKQYEDEHKKHDAETNAFSEEIKKMQLNIRVLEQNLHAVRCECTKLEVFMDHYQGECSRLMYIINNASKAIREASGISRHETKALIYTKRKELLDNLLHMLGAAESKRPRKPSLESVELDSAIYFRGDLGFVPKKQMLKVTAPLRKDIYSQVGSSFEEYQAKQTMESSSDAGLKIISDPEMLRHILKERAKKDELDVEKEESETLFDLLEQESEESVEVPREIGSVDPSEAMKIGMSFIQSIVEDEEEEGQGEEEGEGDGDGEDKGEAPPT